MSSSTGCARRGSEKIPAGLLAKKAPARPLHSLCAAFTPAELGAPLHGHRLRELRVEVVSDRHVVVAGRIGAAPSAAG